MPDDPITSANGENEIYYNGTPTFTPRKIRSSSTIGTNGAPPSPPTSQTAAKPFTSTIDVVSQQVSLASLQPLFDQVASLLDTKGQTLTICQNLPPEIAARYVRQALPGESCWAFYKRMMAVVAEFPPIDVNNLNTTASQLAKHGNDILTSPFSSTTIPDGFDASGDYAGVGGEQRVNNYDEDPGPQTLLLMLFIAIIQPITSLIFNVAYTPMQGMLNKTNDLYNTKQDKSTGFLSGIPGLGFIATAISDTISAITQALGPVATTLFFEAAKATALSLIENIITGGPKLDRDVTRYDSLITTSHIIQTSQYTSDLNYPEAVMLYPQYQALLAQQSAIGNVYSYFTNNSLANSRQGQQPITSAPVMPSDLAQVLQLHQNAMSGILNNMVAVLSQDITDTLVCCLIRLLGAQPPRWLQAAQALLQLALNQQATQFSSLDSVLSNIWHTIEKVILSSILSILYNIFDEINSSIKGDLNAALQSPFFQANTCPPWNLFVQNMLQFIGGMERSILDLVVNLNNSINSQVQNSDIYTAGLQNSIYIRQLLNLINIILSAQQLGTICNGSSIPTDAELQALFDQLKTQLGPPSTTTGTATGTNNLTVTATMVALRSQFNQCLSKVPQQEVEQAMAWIQALTGSTTNG